MKRLFAFVIAAAISVTCAYAQQAPAKEQKKSLPGDWDFFQLTFLPGIPSYPDDSKVCGLKLGAPMSDGKGEVDGWELAVFSSTTDNVDGLQSAGLCDIAKDLCGMQFSIVNYSEKTDGLQLGIVNMSESKGFQIGLVNWIKDGALPFFPIINFSF